MRLFTKNEISEVLSQVNLPKKVEDMQRNKMVKQFFVLIENKKGELEIVTTNTTGTVSQAENGLKTVVEKDGGKVLAYNDVFIRMFERSERMTPSHTVTKEFCKNYLYELLNR